MIFKPQRYSIEDRPHKPFIDPEEIEKLLKVNINPTLESLRGVIEASSQLERLSLRQTSILLNCAPEHRKEIFAESSKLKERVYGDRIVIFAPLYIGNRCINDCEYCGFRASNRNAIRRTLTNEELIDEVAALERMGQKRLILVYGEHPIYDAKYIADTVRTVYSVTSGGHINRVNINAAPFDTEGFKTIGEAGIGTYQIFQETYDPRLYSKYHRSGKKSDFDWRLTALDRAIEAGIDDVGLGALFGLGDWRYEVLALVRHANHLEACYGIGPHTVSFPRIQNASNLDRTALSQVSDEDFAFLVAVLRLAVPYAGLILTAREPESLRNQLIEYGVSQIDAGTRLEIGGYADIKTTQDIDREQFEVSDNRTLEKIVSELIDQGRTPSFCTACYRRGRVGEHFMQFSTRGFIKNFCSSNALLSFAEYLEDYASSEIYDKGWVLINRKLGEIDNTAQIAAQLDLIKRGKRDLYI